MKWTTIFEPFCNIYLKEIRLIIDLYNYHGRYYDVVRVFRKYYHMFAYLVAIGGIARLSLLTYYVKTKDDRLFRYDLTARLMYNQAPAFYDSYILATLTSCLSFMTYIHYETYHRKLAGFAATLGRAMIENNEDLLKNNPKLRPMLWSWDRFCSSPLKTILNSYNQVKQLWFFDKNKLLFPIIFRRKMKNFGFMTTRIRIRIWLLTGVLNEIFLATISYTVLIIYICSYIIHLVRNYSALSLLEITIISMDLIIPFYSIYHWVRTSCVIIWFLFTCMSIVCMVAKELNQRLYHFSGTTHSLVITLVHFYREYGLLVRMILHTNERLVRRVAFFAYNSMIPVSVFSFSALFFKTNVDTLYRLLFASLGLLQVSLFGLVLFPLSLAPKRMHESRKIFVPLQAKLDRRFVKVKFTHHVFYELINSSNVFAYHVGSLFPITFFKIFEATCLYLYAYLFVLGHIYYNFYEI